MKNVPSIISLATVAVLLLLAVAASFIDSLPFAFVASYVVGFACSVGFLALFLADYGSTSPRLIAIDFKEAEAKREAAARATRAQRRPDPQFGAPCREPVAPELLATIGLRNDPSTLSIS